MCLREPSGHVGEVTPVCDNWPTSRGKLDPSALVCSVFRVSAAGGQMGEGVPVGGCRVRTGGENGP